MHVGHSILQAFRCELLKPCQRCGFVVKRRWFISNPGLPLILGSDLRVPVVFGLLIWWHIPGNSGTVFGVSRREKCCCCCGPSSTFKSKSFSSLVLQGRSERVATSGSTLRRQVSHPLLHTTTMFKYARQLMQHCRAYFKWRKPDHSSDGRLRSQSVQMTGYGPQVDPHKKSPMSMSLDNIPESVSNAMPDISLKDLTDIVHVDMEKDRVMAEEDFRPYSKALSKVQARPSSLRLSHFNWNLKDWTSSR